MLPKKNRVEKKAIEKIFKHGKFITSPGLTFKFINLEVLPPNRGRTSKFITPRLSFIVPKKVAKLAVQRNLLRRRGYVALEKYFNKFPAGLLGVFLFRKNEKSIQNLENEIKTILDKIY